MPASPPARPRRRLKMVGKRVVYVTPYANAAKEEGEKHQRMGERVEIKKEKDDMGNYVYVVYVL